MTGSGIIVILIGYGLSFFGVHVGSDQVTVAVTNAMQVVGFVVSIWGQLRRPDLHFGLIRQS